MPAASLTRAMLAPAGASATDAERASIRKYLANRIGPITERLAPGRQMVVTLRLLRQARTCPEALSESEEAFSWKPVFVRRSLGLAVVRACASGRFRAPMEAVGPVATEAVAEWERTGWRTYHWEPWLSGLGPGPRALVLAEAVGWATSLWSSLEWSALPRGAQVGGADDQWICPAPRLVRLKSRSDLRVPLVTGRPGRAGRQRKGPPEALVSVAGGCPSSSWAEELAFLALVAGLRSPSRPVPARVVGLWPDAGTHATAEVGPELLMAAAERIGETVDAVVDAGRSPEGADLQPAR